MTDFTMPLRKPRALWWGVAAFTFLLLSFSLPSAAEATAPSGTVPNSAGHTEHRIIVRYDEALTQRSAEERTEHLLQQPGVVKAQPLAHVGMAVVSLNSSEAAEDLVRKLEEKPQDVLAVPDTWVTAFDFGMRSVVSESEGGTGGLATNPPKQCSANPACRMRGLTVGDCCPVSDGTMLSCCAVGVQDYIYMRTFHNKYIAEQDDGSLLQADAPSDRTLMDIIATGDADGTVGFKCHYSNRFWAADSFGTVGCRAASISDASTKFSVVRNADGTVVVKTSFGLYLSAEITGALVANRQVASELELSQALGWEEFHIVVEPGPGQRVGNDPELARLWAMQDWMGYDIDATEAWHIWTGQSGAGITVAIVDTGIDYTHPELRENMWVNPLEIPNNGIDDDGNGYIDDVHGADLVNEDGDPMDDQMHGTHCAGTITAVGDNGVGIAGVAWRGVRLMALKFLDASGSGRTSDAIRALDYAVAQGAKIASNSWGGGGSNSALRAAIEHAEAAGMLFLVAAGNEGSNNDEVPTFPANYDIENVLSVASTTRDGNLSDFSCYGLTTVDVAAPGSDIYSTVPGNSYASLSGTSMATPHVAGLAALVWMYRPQLSMHQVRAIITGSVVKLPSLEGKTVTGGMINAKNALEAAWAFQPPEPPQHPARGLVFEDTDPRIGTYAGTVTITTAEDESDIEYYKVYFVSGAGFQLEALGEKMPATGAATISFAVNESFVPPAYARGLAVVSGRAAGEMAVAGNGSSTYRVLEDFGLPEYGPKWAIFRGDRDLRAGFVGGALDVRRAENEVSIERYIAYWQTWAGGKGSLVATIPAVGYQEPTCSGVTCSNITVSQVSEGHYVYEHRPYYCYESFRIELSGPGTMTITHFETEHYYDSLMVGDTRLSGNLTRRLPIDLELPSGQVTIRWVSDESIASNGWRFEVKQDGAIAKATIASTEIEGPGFVIYPAYSKNEFAAASAFALVSDWTAEMGGVSPAFVPEAVSFNGTYEGGLLDGLLEVTEAPFASTGNVDFYEVCLALASGLCIEGSTWTISVANSSDANREVSQELEAAQVPEGAVMFAARAGNAMGTTWGFAGLPLEELARRRLDQQQQQEQQEVEEELLRQMPPPLLPTRDGDRDLSVRIEHVEPIPFQRGQGRSETLIWMEEQEAEPHPCVRTAVTIPSFDVSKAGDPAAHAAVVEAFHSSLPPNTAARVIRASAVQYISTHSQDLETGMPRNEQNRQLSTVRFDVEVVVTSPVSGDVGSALDRIESRLILLSSSLGRALDQFSQSLARELAKAEARPAQPLDTSSAEANVVVSPPQQLSARLARAAAQALQPPKP